MKKRLIGSVLILCILLPMFAIGASAATTTSISQFGITWTFSEAVEYGQFANGDYWVVGPVTITSITPATSTVGGVTMHGSMLNPPLSTNSQGFDSRIGSGNDYVESKNVARVMPLVLQPGSSLLSCESHEDTKSNPHNYPQMKTIAILTVLAAPAAEGDFRPPYVGTDKSLNWNKSSLDYSKLGRLPIPAADPSIKYVPYKLSDIEPRFERPWMEINLTWAGRNMHADYNQLSLSGGIGTYGREIANTISVGLLMLQLDYTDAEKETLLIRMVQYGIDIYGAAKLGGNWGNDGGHNMGRKMPMLLAGAVLDDENILEYADAAKHRIFQEDQQSFYISAKEVAQVPYTADDRRREPYTEDLIGMPEWGEKHMGMPQRDGSNWNAYYREINSGTWLGHALTAHIMGLEEEWNWPAYFDYMDRAADVDVYGRNTITASMMPFAYKMWKLYREVEPNISIHPDYIIYDQRGEKIKYSVTYKRTWAKAEDEEFRNVTLILASYNQDGTLAAISQAKARFTTAYKLSLEVPIPPPLHAINKIFLWEDESMAPLIACP